METMNLFGEKAEKHYTKEQLALLEKIFPQNPDCYLDSYQEFVDEYEERLKEFREENGEDFYSNVDEFLKDLGINNEAYHILEMYRALEEVLFKINSFYHHYDKLPDRIKNDVNLVKRMKDLMPSNKYDIDSQDVKNMFNNYDEYTGTLSEEELDKFRS